MELFNNVKKNLHYIVWEVIPNQSCVSLQVVERWTEGGLKEEKVEDTRLVVEEEEEEEEEEKVEEDGIKVEEETNATAI